MPIYAYRCKKCGGTFEEFRGISDKDDDVVCPDCGEKKPHRVMTSFFSKAAGQRGANFGFPT